MLYQTSYFVETFICIAVNTRRSAMCVQLNADLLRLKFIEQAADDSIGNK